ncbi:lysophospholipid acyltransferase family protein [Saccharopolyspora dendranthemae]|uniref:1-acyl-sn-glycerol-3-phosphate acyltransferase n=1 Tax=Saccharopolyspora dendranthemae TaxID=1181886 RepID=A0A561VBR0_9PSEU|nr:lysophospholipid acyltransferase family protein [Saccharopolyspora dendranthemae]TWG09054.1 1-acyl-sn-glycerol-3-phosphate acyltransferase [Saccharopolyspora dendranthemae]
MNHSWMPESPCGPDCLPPRDPGTEVGRLRLVMRIGVTIALLLLGSAMVLALPSSLRRRAVPKWFRMLLRALGIRLEVDGTLKPGGGLVVCNHVSWLDVVALQVLTPMKMLAKVEVRSWPVLGSLAGRVGTVYIDRDRLSALPGAVATIADELRTGAVIGTFPEGTTWCGSASGTFRPAVFQAALDAGTPIQPVAVRFRDGGGRLTTAPAFLGDANLADSVLSVARMRGLVVEVVVLPELTGDDRKSLALEAKAAITGVTGARRGHDVPAEPVAA